MLSSMYLGFGADELLPIKNATVEEIRKALSISEPLARQIHEKL